jgi:hypothetical protein
MGRKKNTLRYLLNPQQTSRESTDSMFRPSQLKAVTTSAEDAEMRMAIDLFREVN